MSQYHVCNQSPRTLVCQYNRIEMQDTYTLYIDRYITEQENSGQFNLNAIVTTQVMSENIERKIVVNRITFIQHNKHSHARPIINNYDIFTLIYCLILNDTSVCSDNATLFEISCLPDC